jgi:hypothetical protein
MPGIGQGNVPLWPTAGLHAQAAVPDHVAGTSTTVRSGNQIIPNGRWRYGLSLVIPPCRRRCSALSGLQDGNACGVTGAGVMRDPPGRGAEGQGAGGVHLPRQGVHRLGRGPPRGRGQAHLPPRSSRSPSSGPGSTCSLLAGLPTRLSHDVTVVRIRLRRRKEGDRTDASGQPPAWQEPSRRTVAVDGRVGRATGLTASGKCSRRPGASGRRPGGRAV